MSYLSKLPVAKIKAVKSGVFLHKHVLAKTNSCSVTYINTSSRCADVTTNSDELINNEQGSTNGNLSPESWNSTESRTVIIWDEGRSVTPPQEIEYVRIH